MRVKLKLSIFVLRRQTSRTIYFFYQRYGPLVTAAERLPVPTLTRHGFFVHNTCVKGSPLFVCVFVVVVVAVVVGVVVMEWRATVEYSSASKQRSVADVLVTLVLQRKATICKNTKLEKV